MCSDQIFNICYFFNIIVDALNTKNKTHTEYFYYTEDQLQEYQSAECFLKLYLFLHSDHVLKLLVLLSVCIAADEIRMQSSTVVGAWNTQQGLLVTESSFTFHKAPNCVICCKQSHDFWRTWIIVEGSCLWTEDPKFCCSCSKKRHWKKFWLA